MDRHSLAVSAQGGKSWHFRYYSQVKQKRMSLGTYPIHEVKWFDLLDALKKIEIRDVMNRRLRPEVRVEPKLVRSKQFDKTRKAE